MTREEIKDLCLRHDVPEYIYNTMLIMQGEIDDLRYDIKRMTALSPAKQEQPDFEALGTEYADLTERVLTTANFCLKQGFQHGAKYVWEKYVAALPYTEDKI